MLVPHQAIYVTQSSFNNKSAKMENKGQKSALEKKANETLKIYSQHSGPAGKLNEEVIRKRKKDEAKDSVPDGSTCSEWK